LPSRVVDFRNHACADGTNEANNANDFRNKHAYPVNPQSWIVSPRKTRKTRKGNTKRSFLPCFPCLPWL
jgi:hypothetical protein